MTRAQRPPTSSRPTRRPGPRTAAPRSASSAPRSARARVKGGQQPEVATSFLHRSRFSGWVIVAIFSVIAVWLGVVQFVQAPDLSAKAASQRQVKETLPATRGAVVDRSGQPIAFTMEAKSLTFQPVIVRKQIQEKYDKDVEAQKSGGQGNTPVTVDDRLQQIAKKIVSVLGDAVSEQKLLEQLRGNETFVYLARGVDPAKASAITDEFTEVGAERQSIRHYPGGSLAANLVGSTGWDNRGLMGMEFSLDSILAGTDGSQTYDRGSDNAVIPGSTREVHPAVNGAKVTLTIDNDVQFFVQQAVQDAKQRSGAKNVQAVVLDAKTGQVVAMANDTTFNPGIGVANNPKSARTGNLPVSSPFEPGSVNKLITAVAAIENGKTKPDEVLQVPGTIRMSGVTVKDAWAHGTEPYTTTGVFGKSSNVGTLMLAQRVGEDAFADYVDKFGLGKATGVGLPGESGGEVPARNQWSGGTFANLPIGQGLSMTLLQMTSMYQALANDGVRVPPRIIKSVDGAADPAPAGEPVRVMSPETSRTVLDMFRAALQRDPMGYQQGTGPGGAVDGWQISGKTGTAQQVDPATKAYSNSMYNITFAGVAPSNDPRFVIGLMMDAPARSSDGTGGQSAAPLFHDIAAFMLQKYGVPLSPPAPKLTLVAGK
ncbi:MULTISPECIES: peptidoglycan D,D-transpeptidase FtsI family protein [Tsukamurella]|uniref:Penicillin-binding protein 2 n=1 Tax=Tsukamurella strandjordii TaxID=147577 RepID=A0AA90NBK0_9ACTN|nr:MULTISPECIES: penicillin-binding protein 2 [Tsukamurella]MDP0399482.1 penicillin-binding protein 2 [Tsukamurella strandjordii]GIZ95657.1 penicillin-binding protein PbpB [Tsukamurella sp. TY48]